MIGAASRIAILATLLFSAPGLAQTITGVIAAKNAGNSPDEIYADLAISYERESAVAVTAASATSVSTRYAGLASADAGLFGGPRLEVLSSDYTLGFSVSAPGAYRLNVSTRRKGDLHLIEDNIFVADHYADMTALTASQTGGTLTSGTLSLGDPGRANDIPFVFDPIFVSFDQTSAATIFAVSNGSAVAHALRFTWSQEAFSSAGGDEAAVRLGGTSSDPTETAADYPGSPARVQAEDGHFVTVTLVSLCGNGVIDSGPSYAEQCDDGALTGTPSSCCTSTCTLRTAGSSCRPAASPCDVGESCTGTSGSCPADGFAPPEVTCRASSAGDVCDVDEHCTGSSADCPADAVAPTGTTCRAAGGVCDGAEACDGSSKLCPSDAFTADGTPCGDGAFCNGDETCQSGSCAAGADPCALGCDEGLDQCLAGACPATPITCRGAAKGTLLFKNKAEPEKDRMVWKWSKGESTTAAEFADPQTDADYATCFYTGVPPALAAELVIPAGSNWSRLGTAGYKYYDGAAAAGPQRISLKGSASSKSKILFKGRGDALPDLMDGAPIDLPITVQLHNLQSGRCWGSTFAAASPSDTTRFKATLP